mmetsp:Transcript_58787/g.165881  ORF Transcript_58787/g.165881 Transcript_58787/m.165881 type:complete len:302 (+) Transcript_58787:2-907(+)
MKNCDHVIARTPSASAGTRRSSMGFSQFSRRRPSISSTSVSTKQKSPVTGCTKETICSLVKWRKVSDRCVTCCDAVQNPVKRAMEASWRPMRVARPRNVVAIPLLSTTPTPRRTPPTTMSTATAALRYVIFWKRANHATIIKHGTLMFWIISRSYVGMYSADQCKHTSARPSMRPSAISLPTFDHSSGSGGAPLCRTFWSSLDSSHATSPASMFTSHSSISGWIAIVLSPARVHLNMNATYMARTHHTRTSTTNSMRCFAWSLGLSLPCCACALPSSSLSALVRGVNPSAAIPSVGTPWKE